MNQRNNEIQTACIPVMCKTISLLQPWASLVVMGAKRYETRSWQTKYRGPLFIHASQSKREANKMIYQYPFNKVLCDHYNRKREIDVDELPFGAIIGVVDLVNVFPTRDVVSELSEQERSFGDYSFGRYAWELRNPMMLAKPIQAKGALSIWEFNSVGVELTWIQ